MFEIIRSGGWLMFPIIACSVIALAIIAERIWCLRRSKVAPENLLQEITHLSKNNQLNRHELANFAKSSALGRILVAGIVSAKHGRSVMKENIEMAASQSVHSLQRYLNTLGTVAAIAPLLGLLGTVIGMIRVFADIMIHGTGDSAQLAGGISEALITTAAGLTVAIPALFFHRYFLRLIDDLTVSMEVEAVRLVEMMQAFQERSTGAKQDVKDSRDATGV